MRERWRGREGEEGSEREERREGKWEGEGREKEGEGDGRMREEEHVGRVVRNVTQKSYLHTVVGYIPLYVVYIHVYA